MQTTEERIEDLENQVAILKKFHIEADLIRHIATLRERVEALEASE